jgi:hypothetical protein
MGNNLSERATDPAEQLGQHREDFIVLDHRPVDGRECATFAAMVNDVERANKIHPNR